MRITAEDPYSGFLPNSGTLNSLTFSSDSKTFGYFSLTPGSSIHNFADSQIGHIFSSSFDRNSALSNLVSKVRSLNIDCNFGTSHLFMAKVISNEIFQKNIQYTTWLDELISKKELTLTDDSCFTQRITRISACIGVYKILSFSKIRNQKVEQILRAFQIEFTLFSLSIKCKVSLLGKNTILCRFVNNFCLRFSFYNCGIDKIILIDDNNILFNCKIYETIDLYKIVHNGDELFCHKESKKEKSFVKSPTTGKIAKIHVENLSEIKKGQLILEIESMKMYLTIKSHLNGIVKLLVNNSSDIEKGTLLAEIVGDEEICTDLDFLKEYSPLEYNLKESRFSVQEIKKYLVNGYLLESIRHELLDGYFSDELVLELLNFVLKIQEGSISFLQTFPDFFKEPNFLSQIALIGEIIFKKCFTDKIPSNSLLSNIKVIINKLIISENNIIKRFAQKAREFVLNFESHRLEQLLKEIEARLYGISSFIREGKKIIHASRTVALDLTPNFFGHSDKELGKAALLQYFAQLYDMIDYKFIEISHSLSAIAFEYIEVSPGDYNGSYSIVSLQKTAFAVFLKTLCPTELGDVLDCINFGFKRPISIMYVFTTKASAEDKSFFQSFIGEKFQGKVNDKITLGILSSNFIKSMFIHIFEKSSCFKENKVLRNIDPELSYLLEVERVMDEYEISNSFSNSNGSVHIMVTNQKGNKGTKKRLFVRTIIRPDPSMYEYQSVYDLKGEALSVVGESFEAAYDLVLEDKGVFIGSHLFINLLPIFINSIDEIEEMIRYLFEEFRYLIYKMNFTECELKVRLKAEAEKKPLQYRIFVKNPTGELLSVFAFLETISSLGHKKLIPVKSWRGDHLTFEESEIVAHPLLTFADELRSIARSFETLFLYDFPELILYHLNGAGSSNIAIQYFSLTESGLSLENFTDILSMRRIGMFAWIIRYGFKDQPLREVIFIGNDITFNSGAFGIEEDEYFYAVTQYCIRHKIPRIFLSANSGAKVGIADEVIDFVKLKFVDEEAAKGIDYLYVTPSDYEAHNLSKSIRISPIWSEATNSLNYKITDIIGSKGGIGVENLSGSGLIAGITSIAYDSIFTLSVVSGRTVGIGAYLVRLGIRVIQKFSQPIILTGNNALNKILGREVYPDNLVIGGPQVMGANGISHIIVSNDLQAIGEIFKWLSFIPFQSGGIPWRIHSKHSVLRKIQREMELNADPRELLTKNGFLDEGSFVEVMSEWAKTVIVGRGRLGGFPIGIIATENRTIEFSPPCDYASDKESEVISQAGQVWYPDSAFKTASALKDFRQSGENLPVLIFANWRGFSGGTRDMYEGILKFGSMIVDELVKFKNPIYVYIIGELRGGSWVVIDSKINPEFIEMYAEPRAKGGILEPEGVLSVKFKPEGANIKKIQKNLNLDSKTAARVALEFISLHDTSGRMESVGVVKGLVPFGESRNFFIKRLESFYQKRQDG